MNKRIGPKMQLAYDFVRDNPGCCKLPVAEHAGANGSRRYGYAVVDRAIKAGLLEVASVKGGRYALYAAIAK